MINFMIQLYCVITSLTSVANSNMYVFNVMLSTMAWICIHV